MSDITINYKGSSIATMDASGTKTLLTEGKYCEDDIEVVYVKPGGGGDSYVCLEYIQSVVGSPAYMISDITPAMLMAKDLKFTYTVSYYAGKLSYGPHLLSTVNCMLPLLRNNSNGQVFWNILGVGTDGVSQSYSTNTQYTFVYDFAANTLTLNGNSIQMAQQGSSTPESNLWFLSYSDSPANNTVGNVRLYSIKVEKNGEIFRQYYPVARTSDIKTGLYETETGTFFYSSSGNNFTAGPIVAWP